MSVATGKRKRDATEGKLLRNKKKKKSRTTIAEFYPSAVQAARVSQALADSCTLVIRNVPDKSLVSGFPKSHNDYAIERFFVNEQGNVRVEALALKESKAAKRFEVKELNCIRSLFDPATETKRTVPLLKFQAPPDLFPDPDTRPQAQERAAYFAQCVAQQSPPGAKRDDRFILVLDGPAWRNVTALLRAGIDASRILLFEKRNETAIYHRHRALLLGLPIHVIYTGTHQRKADDGFEGYIRKRLIRKVIPGFTNDQIQFLYADYCGHAFDDLVNLFADGLLPNVKLAGITAGKRNRTRDIPKLLDQCIRRFDHATVECCFYVKTL